MGMPGFGFSVNGMTLIEADHSDMFTADGVVMDGPGFFLGVSGRTGGVNDLTIDLWDSPDSTLDGDFRVIPTLTKPGSETDLSGAFPPVPVRCSKGLYLDITSSGGGGVVVYYKQDK